MSKKSKLIATIMAMCLVISLGVIGILAVRTLNMKIGGNITFNAEGIAFTVGEGKFYEDDATTIYTGISSQTGKMQGFSMDTDTKLTDVSAAIATWTDLELGLDNRGDAILKFNVSNDMSDKELYIVFDIKHGTNTNDNMLIKTELLQTISADDDKDIEIKFDILDMDLNAGLEGFEIAVTFTDKVQANNSGTVTNNTTTALTNVKYTVTDATKKEVSATPVADDIAGNVIIPETVYIGDEPYTVTSIPENAFSGNANITSVFIPSTVKTIGESAFDCCCYLVDIQLSEGIERIESCAFTDCYWISELILPDSLEYIGSSAFDFLGESTQVTVKFGKNIETIEGSAFSSTGIVNKELIIPSTVKTIGSAAFSGWLNLEKITVESGNTKFYAEGNCLIETLTGRLIKGCKNSIIPNDATIKKIDSYAFWGCDIEHLTIPASVTFIGDYAVAYCKMLREVIIEATTPPTLDMGDSFWGTEYPIYVPANSVNAYKTANGWEHFVNRIFPIS